MLQKPLSPNAELEKIDEVIWLFHKRNSLYFVQQIEHKYALFLQSTLLQLLYLQWLIL